MHDQVSDRGQIVFHKLASSIFDEGVTGLTKSATTEIPTELPGTAYGDPTTRRFPCHTKESTIKSALYFYGQLATGNKWDSMLPSEKVAQRIDRAAEFFNVKNEIGRIKAQASDKGVPKTASISLSDDAYIICENNEGTVVRRFPAVNAPSTKKAAEALVKYRAHYPFTWRKKAATTVLQRAMSYNVDLDPTTLSTLTKMAGIVPVEAKTAGYNLLELSNSYRGKAANTIRDAAHIVASGTLSESDVCTLCELMDKTASVFEPHHRPMVEDAMFTVPVEKKAEAPESVTLTTGNTYDIGSLMQVPQDTYMILGEDISRSIVDNSGALDAKKMTDILPTLPRPEANLLETALNAVHVAPRNEKEAKRRGADSVFDSLEGWESFLKERGSVAKTDYRLNAPLRHPADVHDYLSIT